MPATINPDATLIPDKAEVWIILASDVDSIAAKIPATPTEDLSAKGWLFTGLIDDKKGIPLTPGIEVKEYDAFGHPRFRVKLRKGKLETGFTALETNAATRKIVLPGSAPNKIGAPKDVQIFVLYRFIDEDIARLWVTLTKAPVELKSHGGFIDGELSFAELVVHHTTDANGDVFQIVEVEAPGAPDVTTWVVTLTGATGGDFTSAVDGGAPTADTDFDATNAEYQAALVAVLGAGGATVAGNAGGPYTVTLADPGTLTVDGAGLTPVGVATITAVPQ